jgi:DNA-directed RNA polymerase subunit RPC12/RpoP
MSLYTCGRCGKVVDKSSRVCPHCGARLGNIKCKNCGFSGSEEDFIGDRCPRCNTSINNIRGLQRCTVCGRQFSNNDWACPYCGHVVWRRIGIMVGITVLCVGAALYVLPFPSLIGWLVIGVGAVSLFIAAGGLGSALEIRRSYLFAISFLMIAGLVLSGLVMHKKGYYLHVFPETATPIPSMTPTLTPTITLTPTPAPPASPTPIITPTPAGQAVVQRIQINVRLGPSTDDNVVDFLNMHDQVAILGRSPDGNWLLIETTKNTTGWISADLVTVDPPLDKIPVITPSSP